MNRPIVYLAVHDPICRSRISDALHRQGWAVIEAASGFHLIEALSGLIEGDGPWQRPGLIVVDAVLRGCSGLSIAEGLRDLGLLIPTVLVIQPGQYVPCSDDHAFHVVDAATAPASIAELARPLSPARVLDSVIGKGTQVRASA